MAFFIQIFGQFRDSLFKNVYHHLLFIQFAVVFWGPLKQRVLWTLLLQHYFVILLSLTLKF